MRYPRAGSAFTLIELLVVIGIIVLLMGILLPALTKGRESGRRAICLAHLRQLVIAQTTYSLDDQKRMTAGRFGCVDDGGGGIWDWDTKTGRFYKGGYLQSENVWFCPDDLGWRNYDGPYPRHKAGDPYQAKTYTYSFTLSGQMAMTQKDMDTNVNSPVATSLAFTRGQQAPCETAAGNDSSGSSPLREERITQFPFPRKQIVYAEEGTGWIRVGDPRMVGDRIYINDPDFTFIDQTEPRHNETSQAAFLDGHAAVVNAFISLYRDPDYWGYNPAATLSIKR